jgi:hypothetical protein
MFFAPELHVDPDTVDSVVILYTPGVRLVNSPVVLVTAATTGLIPTIEYEIPAPGSGAVTLTDPVATAQVGGLGSETVGVAARICQNF